MTRPVITRGSKDKRLWAIKRHASAYFVLRTFLAERILLIAAASFSHGHMKGNSMMLNGFAERTAE